jgi:cholesterol transport system auxiliary component
MKSPRLPSGRAAAFFTTAILTLICVLAGCLSKPALNRQTFAFSVPETAPTNITISRVLAIRKLDVAAPFEGRSLVYRTGESAFVRDPYAEFLENPRDTLIVIIREWLRNHDIFAAVVEPGSALKPDTIAEIAVMRLYGDFRQPKRPAAILTMRFLFFDATNAIPGRVLLEREYTRSIALNLATPAALLEGWNQGLAQILTEVSADLQGLEGQQLNERASLRTSKVP